MTRLLKGVDALAEGHSATSRLAEERLTEAAAAAAAQTPWRL